MVSSLVPSGIFKLKLKLMKGRIVGSYLGQAADTKKPMLSIGFILGVLD